MPFAKIDVEMRTDPRWDEIPARSRAAAKAIYIDAVLYSAEMLTDGHLNRQVFVGISKENGVERFTKVCGFLVDSGLLMRTKRGFLIPEWHHFHSSREDVHKIRKRDAERKRTARSQLPLGDVHPGRPENVQAGQRSDSRAHERRRAAAEVRPKAVTAPRPPAVASETDFTDEPQDDAGQTASTNGLGFNITDDVLRSIP